MNVLATQLVDQWLKIVKDETVPPEVTSTVLIVKQEDIVVEEEVTTSAETHTTVDSSTSEPSQIVISPQSFYKLTVRDGKQVIAKVDSVVNNSVSKVEQSDESVIDNMTVVSEETCATVSEQTENTEHLETRDKKEVKKNSSSSNSSNSSSRDKDRSRHKHKSSSSRSSSSSSNKDKHTSSKDKYRSKDREHREHREKSKHRSNGSTKNNEKKEENQAEKDKDTLAKIQPKTMEKMGRIPKKSDDKDKDKTKNDKDKKSEPRNKPSISIEVRKKDSGEKPRKTVKVFHSKLRSTGLEEAAKPPPPRTTTPKKPPTVPSLPLKLASPSREVPPPPEKRLKLPDAEVEKPGGIKLIPAKPKRKYFTANSNLDFRLFFRASLVVGCAEYEDYNRSGAARLFGGILQIYSIITNIIFIFLIKLTD